MMKKYVWQLVKDKVVQHEETIECICKDLHTAKEVEALGKLFAEIYEAGFMRCVEEHRDKLETLGLAAKVVSDEKPRHVAGKPIFQD